MRFVFVCHASRLRDSRIPDRYQPLDDAGEADACALGAELDEDERDIKPQVFFTSWYAHAKQTADILRIRVGAFQTRVVELCTLTPSFPGEHHEELKLNERDWAGLPILSWISSEAAKVGNPLEGLQTAVFVTHQPRLAQLLRALTSETEPKYNDLHTSEGVCLIANDLPAFLGGQGREDGIWFRRQ